jgi:hypothetical protein
MFGPALVQFQMKLGRRFQVSQSLTFQSFTFQSFSQESFVFQRVGRVGAEDLALYGDGRPKPFYSFIPTFLRNQEIPIAL